MRSAENPQVQVHGHQCRKSCDESGTKTTSKVEWLKITRLIRNETLKRLRDLSIGAAKTYGHNLNWIHSAPKWSLAMYLVGLETTERKP